VPQKLRNARRQLPLIRILAQPEQRRPPRRRRHGLDHRLGRAREESAAKINRRLTRHRIGLPPNAKQRIDPAAIRVASPDAASTRSTKRERSQIRPPNLPPDPEPFGLADATHAGRTKEKPLVSKGLSQWAILDSNQ
jgi:hypothetical protein